MSTHIDRLILCLAFLFVVVVFIDMIIITTSKIPIKNSILLILGFLVFTHIPYLTIRAEEERKNNLRK